MAIRDPEYDGFGPWVLEISAADPPPALFRPHLTWDEVPLLSIKIPRKIDRRDARPGMNLYDYMVMLFEDDLVILERDGDDVRSASFVYEELQYLRYLENLLKGNLHLATAGRAYDLPFNAVSKAIMRRLVTMIRERYAGEGGNTAIPVKAIVPSGEFSFFFTNLLAHEHVRNPEFRLLAAQADTPVGAHESGRLRRLLFGALGRTLLESLHLSDGRELKIISRGQTYRYKWQTVYALETLCVPVNKITGIAWETDSKNAAISNLDLKTAGGSISFAFFHDNPSMVPYSSFLATASRSPVQDMSVISP